MQYAEHHAMHESDSVFGSTYVHNDQQSFISLSSYSKGGFSMDDEKEVAERHGYW